MSISVIRNRSYRKLSLMLFDEALEPTLSWGLRMAIAAIVPVVWGLATDRMEDAKWITLTVECICWVELKGAFQQRIRVLTAGVLLAVSAGLLGSITGSYLWLSVAAMLLIGFLSALFKNLGDRGSGLAICVYVLFILSNSFPVTTTEALQHRVGLILAGSLWALVISSIFSFFLPLQEPYRRSIALIWRANAVLLGQVARGWDGSHLRSSIREIYQRETDVRKAIDNSLHLYERMAHQAGEPGTKEYHLAQLRKASSLTATHITAINEELEGLKLKDTPERLRLKINALLLSVRQVAERMSVYIMTLRPEDELLISTKINKLNKRITMLQDAAPEHPRLQDSLQRVALLTARMVRLMEKATDHLDKMGNDTPVYRSYSLLKTLFILHPPYWRRNLRLFFHLNSFMARYAFRSAVAAALAMFLYKWFAIERGYWIAFTVMIVVQPYIGATIKKAIERVAGTIAGGIAAGWIVRQQTDMYLKEIMLFVCFFFMVFFIRKKYSAAVFFMTISLVLIFHVEDQLDPFLILIRALSTAGGAVLGIIAGFALLPSWDRKQLPLHYTNAIHANYQYFMATFFPGEHNNSVWTKNKRTAELHNSNAFDSFNRYMQEPGIGKKIYISYYQLIMHNIRITRELNNINLEYDDKAEEDPGSLTEQQEAKIRTCLSWFSQIEAALVGINPTIRPIPVQNLVLQPRTLSVYQLFYVEKIVAELKAMYPDLLEHRNRKRNRF